MVHTPGLDTAPEKSGPLYAVSMVVPYVLTAGLLVLLIYCHVNSEPFNISGEDGFVEWGSTVSLSLCALLAMTAAWTHRRELTRAQVILLVVFALVALGAVGEELSWGQRLLGFKGPLSMDTHGGAALRTGHNDVTIHNLTIDLGFMKFSPGGALFGVPLFIGLFLHGVWLPVRVKRGGRKAVAFVNKLGLFLPPMHLGVLVLVGAVFFHYRRMWHHTDSREYKEMLVPTVYVFILLHCFFRQRKPLATAVTAVALALLVLALAWSWQQGMMGLPAGTNR